ncbi:MAG: transporter substrate-binding domain-containing protein, partial [Clostridia bacterium]|nr:transporter substrate-binding domain-containing protein [Clostridia bacterium]
IQADEQLKTLNYTPVSYQSNALMEVKAGTSDVAVLDYVMAKAMVGEGTDYTDLQMIEGLELNAEEYAIGFRKNSPETLKKVDEAINTLIENGTLDEIAEKYGLFDSLLSNQ